MDIVKDRLSYCGDKLDKGDVNLWEQINLMKDMVHLLDSTSVFRKANVEGRKWEKSNPDLYTIDLNLQNDKMVNAQLQILNPAQGEQQLNDDEMASVHEEQPSVQEITSSKQTPQSLNKFHLSQQLWLSMPYKKRTQRKGIATEEEPVKHLMPLIEQGGSDPKMLNLQQFNISRKKMTLEDAQAQLTQIKRNNQPLSLTVYEKFVLKKLGFIEWIEVHTLASKNKSKANDILLKNLKAKFEWIKTQAGKLGIPPPPELTAFGLSPAEKNRKKSLEMIKEVFVNEDIVVDGMHRNLIPPPGVEGSRGLVIKEPESGIFFYNRNFDLAKICIKGLAECKASASNLRRIQVKDIFKDVEDYLKTYSSGGMNISLYVEGIRCGSKESQRWQYSDYPITI
ncbi:hypothetical protein Tco_1144848 [Tanacetum coccineum]